MAIESVLLEKGSLKSAESPVIVVNNLTKDFYIPHERRTTLFEGIRGIFRPNTYEKFVALNDISFTVKRGEAIGIIGDNGSGKSTLLKILAGILKPTCGDIKINGRVTPFLELGVGFQPDLSARENIEIYSAIMGLPEKEIQNNINSVLEFAGLLNFKDTKLKNFSSGMQVRLAFSTAIQVKPDILIVDEVLAVGDIEFQQKCLDVFNDYKKAGVTILFVSHDLNTIRTFCNRTLFLKNGRLISFGNTNEIIDRYVYGVDRAEVLPVSSLSDRSSSTHTVMDKAVEGDGDIEPESVRETGQQNDRWGNRDVEISQVIFIDKFDNENNRFNSHDPMTIRIYYNCKRHVEDIVFGIALYTDNDILCFGTNTDISGVELGSIESDGYIDIHIAEIPIISGKYLLTLAAHSKDHVPYDWHDKKYSFTVISSGKEIGLFNIKCSWAVPSKVRMDK